MYEKTGKANYITAPKNPSNREDKSGGGPSRARFSATLTRNRRGPTFPQAVSGRVRVPALERQREASLIVICPSCCRRYRHDFAAQAAQVAHCAACDERFEPVPAKRTYVLVPGGAVPAAGLPPTVSGMNDPLLAGKLLDASLGAGFGAPTPVSVDAVTVRESTSPGPRSIGPALESDGPYGEGRIGPRVMAALDASIAVVPCGLGAGLAYYFAGSLNQDPIISAILGGVTGLLLGWACMLWIAHAD